MLQTDPCIVAAGRCRRRDRMCWGEAWAFVATQPTGPEPWPLTLHPGGQTKLWVTSETRHSVGRECLDRTQITPLTPQKRFTAIYSQAANFLKQKSHKDGSKIIKQLEVHTSWSSFARQRFALTQRQGRRKKRGEASLLTCSSRVPIGSSKHMCQVLVWNKKKKNLV